MVSDAFSTGFPSAVTPPASIAARARARLSNRPRSTSTTSARVRGGVSLLFLVNLKLDLPRGPAGRQTNTGLEQGEIVPDISGRLVRRHQWAAMQIERVDHHEIIRPAEIFHG